MLQKLTPPRYHTVLTHTSRAIALAALLLCMPPTGRAYDQSSAFSLRNPHEAVKANAVFEKLHIIPSYTVKSNLDFSNTENARGISAFNYFAKASSGQVPYSIEVDAPSADAKNPAILNRLQTSFSNQAGFTYHLRRLGDSIINLSRKDFQSEVAANASDFPLIITTFHPTYISVHLGWGAEDIGFGTLDGHDVAQSPQLDEQLLHTRMVTNLLFLKNRLARSGYDTPLLIETLDYYEADAKGAYAHVTNPAFVHSVLATVNTKKTNVRLLVDTSHLLVAAKNNGLYTPDNFMSYVKAILTEDTIALVDELHVVVPVLKAKKEIDRYVDIHTPLTSSSGPAREVREILTYFFAARERMGITHPVIVNFESGIKNADKELLLLAKELENL
jgi:hypothetical protein